MSNEITSAGCAFRVLPRHVRSRSVLTNIVRCRSATGASANGANAAVTPADKGKGKFIQEDVADDDDDDHEEEEEEDEEMDEDEVRASLALRASPGADACVIIAYRRTIWRK